VESRDRISDHGEHEHRSHHEAGPNPRWWDETNGDGTDSEHAKPA
jgi:hypothetical protein